MGHQVIVLDFAAIRGMWEIRVKKHKEREKKEKQRIAQSALEKIRQEWDIILECRRNGIPQAAYLNNGVVDTNKILDKVENNSPLIKKITLLNETQKERNKFIFHLSGEHWTEFPDSLKEQTHLKEWHISNTMITTIPAYIALFQELRVLELPSNLITELPTEIGRSPETLESPMDCKKIKPIHSEGNHNLKKVTFVDVSANSFPSIPICVLRMSSLQWLDMSSNNLKDLPQDIDRLEELQTLLLQKNELTYLPQALVNMSKLTLLAVSGDKLVKMPTAICESTTGLKFISLKDNPLETTSFQEIDEITESDRDRELFEKEFMKAYITDLRERGTDIYQ
uniref:Leucine rich repeat containing 2 n=1 Tax=Podarcis muralis TaxID=64176 RepID=A0A670JDP3_PODMU